MHLLGRYYRQVEAGRKTIEVRVATPQKRAVAVGDTVVFHDRDTGRELDVIVQRITPYHSFEDLLSSEDTVRIDPDGPPGELLANLRSIYPPAKEALGVLALAFDHRPARAGRPMPITPTQYAQTVPHHTVYGCLYIRDEIDRPIQLHSVYGSRLWQFPGPRPALPARSPAGPARSSRPPTPQPTGRLPPEALPPAHGPLSPAPPAFPAPTPSRTPRSRSGNKTPDASLIPSYTMPDQQKSTDHVRLRYGF
jgi:ASC-1-like (ASCH) protein